MCQPEADGDAKFQETETTEEKEQIADERVLPARQINCQEGGLYGPL